MYSVNNRIDINIVNIIIDIINISMYTVKLVDIVIDNVDM